jgi:signal transduction histidine kinase
MKSVAPGATLAEALPPEAHDALHELVEEAARTAGVVHRYGLVVPLFSPAGVYNVHVVPLEPSSTDAHWLLVMEDLSAVTSLETQLLRAEKLATVGVLAAGIAHEIGTPLSVVRGRAEYVQDKLGASHPQRDGLRVIVEQIDFITRTIRQLLDFARARPPAVRPVALDKVVDAVVDLLQFEVTRRQLDLTVALPPDLPRVAADADQLQQVLVNLAMNACDACAAGGHIVITAACDTTRTLVAIEVKDDGCGVADELRHQIFDPFFTTKKRGQGTGLGLAIAAQIVRGHSGAIDLTSKPGEGTVVRVMWPVATLVDRPRAGERHDASTAS